MHIGNAHCADTGHAGLEASRIDYRSLGNSWHRDFAASTESVYKLELLPVALYDADDQKATILMIPIMKIKNIFSPGKIECANGTADYEDLA